MSTENKALVELAAKAAAYKFDSASPFEICIPYKGYNNWYGWNPCEDDAQCLQLARQLGINIDYSDKCASKRMPGLLLQEYFGLWSHHYLHATWAEA